MSNALFIHSLPIEKDVTGGRCIQTQQRSPYCRLAAAGFSYQTEGFPGLMEKETPSTAFKGVVFINPVLIGKYCFKSRTSTRYSLLFFTSSLTVCLLFLPPWLPLRSASRMRNDRQAFAFPAAALRYRSSSLPRSAGKMHSPLAYLRG